MLHRSVLSYFTAELPSEAPPPVEEKKYMDIFCDGACLRNGDRLFGSAGIGVYVLLENKPFAQVSERLEEDEPQTNQRAELQALKKALEYAVECPEEYDIRIFSDSEYAIKCITVWASQWRRNNWMKKTENEEVMHKHLIEEAYFLWLSIQSRVTIEHVKSHTEKQDWKSQGNKVADRLAVSSIRQPGSKFMHRKETYKL